MQRVEGKKQRPISTRELIETAAAYDRRLIDLGCGDGRFVLRTARENKDWACIGIDAVADPMRECARRAGAKPTKGGAPNALYVLSSIEALPDDLVGIATHLTIQYAWGSLLRVFVQPDMKLLTKIARLAAGGATFSVLINCSVFDDPDYVARLALPSLDESRFRAELAPAWLKAGLAVESIETQREAAETPSSWGKRLVKGSGREVLAIKGTISRNAQTTSESALPA